MKGRGEMQEGGARGEEGRAKSLRAKEAFGRGADAEWADLLTRLEESGKRDVKVRVKEP